MPDPHSGCPFLARTAVHAGPERGTGLLREGQPFLQDLRRRWSATSAEIRLLGRRTVELLNILRPTVAAAWFVGFAAHRLAAQPTLRDELRAGGDAAAEAFAHELRRLYPFVPAPAAVTRRRVRHEGQSLRAGRRVLLDVYGTLHDPTSSPDPDAFRLDRFAERGPDAGSYVPQGDGPAVGQRCPGERVTVELIRTALPYLLDRVPAGADGELDLRRIPVRPR